MKIAIIILNYNSFTDCKKCIGSLKKQENLEAEIIVVDNCSEREDRLKVEQLCQKEDCKFIANSKNLGYNAGNNVGLRYAASKGYKYALITNPDMEFPDNNYIINLVDVMESDEQIAVCGSDIVTPEGIHQSPMKKDGNWKNSFGWIAKLCRKKTNDTYSFIDNYGQSHYCSKVSGCCLLVRMSFIKEIGFFDEYPFLYCEEAILSRQVEQSAKWKMYYTANIRAIHRHLKDKKGDPIPRFKQWRRSRKYFILQYSGDSWMGKRIAIISLYLDVFVITTALYLKNKFNFSNYSH